MKKLTLLFIFLTITSLSAQDKDRNFINAYVGFGGTSANGTQAYICTKLNTNQGIIVNDNVYLGFAANLNGSLGKQYSDSDSKFAGSVGIMHGYKKGDGPSWMGIPGDQCLMTGIDVINVKTADILDKFSGSSAGPSILHTGSFSNGNKTLRLSYALRLTPFDYSSMEFNNTNPEYPNRLPESSLGVCIDVNAHVEVDFVSDNGDEVEITGKCRYYSKEYDDAGKMTYVATGLSVDYHIYDKDFGFFGDAGTKTFKTENLITDNADKATTPYANLGVIWFISLDEKH